MTYKSTTTATAQAFDQGFFTDPRKGTANSPRSASCRGSRLRAIHLTGLPLLARRPSERKSLVGALLVRSDEYPLGGYSAVISLTAARAGAVERTMEKTLGRGRPVPLGAMVGRPGGGAGTAARSDCSANAAAEPGRRAWGSPMRRWRRRVVRGRRGRRRCARRGGR
jgi:hypothetical protein